MVIALSSQQGVGVSYVVAALCTSAGYISHKFEIHFDHVALIAGTIQINPTCIAGGSDNVYRTGQAVLYRFVADS